MLVRSSTQKASKDCPKCVIRRIKCDRGLPECRKCKSRKLQCPGYGLILKWDQGIASRGRFRGQPAPVEVRKRQLNSSIDFSVDVQAENIESRPERSEEDLTIDKEQTLHKYSAPVPDFLQSPATRRLLDHYNKEVAPILAWVDSPENPWRKLVLPLSSGSESVLYSILTLSAQHLVSKYPQHQALEVRSNVNNYRNKALQLLAEQLRQERVALAQGSHKSHEDAVNAALASMLVLFNADLTQADSEEWRMHIRAARAIIRGLGDSHHLPDPHSATSAFLYQEFFSVSAYAIMTTFEDDKVHDVTLKSDGNAIFIEFLRIVHDVTILERKRYMEAQQGLPLTFVNLESISENIKQAKERSMRFGQNLNFHLARLHQDFIHVVNIIHNACIVYSCQALAGGKISKQDIDNYKNQMVDHFSLVIHRNYFAQDLFWPLFIIATESRGDVIGQQQVENWMSEVMHFSGALDRRRAIVFLKAFWAQDNDDITWIEMARSWTGGNDFLIL